MNWDTSKIINVGIQQNGIEDAVSKKKYATYEQDYWTANGDFYFAPRSGIADTEYISSQIANAAGSFTTNPLIEIQLEASFKCYGIKIKFSDNLPEAFTIRTFLNDVVNSTNNISSVIEKDFEFSYFDGIDDALIEGLSQNQDFFSLLLNNEEIKREVLGIFTSEIYKSLREADWGAF